MRDMAAESSGRIREERKTSKRKGLMAVCAGVTWRQSWWMKGAIDWEIFKRAKRLNEDGNLCHDLIQVMQAKRLESVRTVAGKRSRW